MEESRLFESGRKEASLKWQVDNLAEMISRVTLMLSTDILDSKGSRQQDLEAVFINKRCY